MTETRHDEFEVMAASYAIDTLDVDDRKLFEAHLAGCEACRASVAEYRRVTAGLGLGVDPVEPPASLKARTIARATGRRMPAAAPAPMPAPRPSYGWLAAAAAVLLAAAAGMYANYQRNVIDALRSDANQTRRQAQQLRDELATSRVESQKLARAMAVLAASDLMRFDLAATPDGTAASARAFWSRTHGLLVSADRLPPLQPGRAYQLWIVLPNTAPIGAGVFTVTSAGSATMIAQPAGDLNVPRNTLVTIAITNEPAGGSIRPTPPILLAGNAKTE